MMSIKGDGRAQTPSEAIVRRVAAREGVDPTELDPLYDTIDPDVLDTAVRSSAEYCDSNLEIEFVYDGYDVTVTADGVVHVDAKARPTG